MFVDNLEVLLGRLVFANPENINEEIKQVSSLLNSEYFSKSESVPALLEIMCRNEHWQIRQCAAVELKKVVSKFWRKIQDAQTKAVFKKNLLEWSLKEPEQKVRNSLASVISNVAKNDVPEGLWNELMSFLDFCIKSENGAERQIGIFVLFNLLESIPETFETTLGHVLEICNRCLSDSQNFKVRVYGFLSLGIIGELLVGQNKKYIEGFKAIVPAMVQVLQDGISLAEYEDDCIRMIETFDTLLSSDVPVLSKHAIDLIKLFCQIAARRDLSNDIRIMSLNFLMWAIVYKKNKISKENITSSIIESVMPICLEGFSEDENDDECPSKVTCQLIHSIALNLPNNQVFPCIMSYVGKFIVEQSKEYRVCAMMSFANIIEGCTEPISECLNEIIRLSIQGLNDPDVDVMKASCFALSNLCEFLDEEVANYHSQVLPILLRLLENPDQRLLSQCLIALDFLIENIQGEMKTYVHPLMTKLNFILQTESTIRVKSTVVGVLGTIASSCGDEVKSYFPQLIEFLRHCCQLTETDSLSLRAMAIDSVSSFAVAVGKDDFRPYLESFMSYSIKGLDLDNSRLRECSYIFFGHIAELYGAEFAIYLPVILPEMVKSLNADEFENLQSDSEKNVNYLANEEDDDDDYVYVSSAIIEEKETACDSLSKIFSSTRDQFLPYFSHLLEIVCKLVDHDHDSLRKAALSNLYQSMGVLFTIYHGSHWLKGLENAVNLAPEVSTLHKTVIEITMNVLEKEIDKMVVSHLFLDLAELTKIMGPSLILNNYEKLIAFIIRVFERKSPSQQMDAEEDADGEDESSDCFLIECAVDLVSAVAQAMGANFAPYFRAVLPHLLPFYSQDRPAADRSMIVGSLGEIAGSLEEAITEFSPTIFPIVLNSLSDKNDEVRSNGAFATGLLCYYTKIEQLKQQYDYILGLLYPLFSQKTQSNITDNACGAVARMVLANPEAVKLDQILPVLFESLPLRKDFDEYAPVCTLLLRLSQGNSKVLDAYGENIIKLCVSIFQIKNKKDGKKVSEAVLGECRQLLQLASSFSADKPYFTGELKAAVSQYV